MSIQACIMSHAVSAPVESHGILLRILPPPCGPPVPPAGNVPGLISLLDTCQRVGITTIDLADVSLPSLRTIQRRGL